MSSLYHDSRLYYILGANSLSAIGSGIVMITIPLLLIKESGGETTFGYVSIIATLIMFLLTPFIGQSIDRFSRKSLLLCNEGIGIAVIGIMVIWGFAGQPYHSIHYILIYIAGSFYYLLFYPTIFAFNQEIFQAEHYKSLSGTMEIQGQLTQVISGAAASFLIEIVSLKWILLVDMLTFAGAFFLFLCIPYVKKKEVKRKITFKKQLFEGIHFMKKRPKLFWFLLATYMPFIGVMMANYLIPVYISDILKANASVYAIEGTMYGVGAVVAGICIPLIMKYVKTEVSIVMTMFIYVISITAMSIEPSVMLLYGLAIFHAIGNAGTRVARNVLMMEEIPNEVMGRVDSLFRLIGTGIRIVLLMLFTAGVSKAGVMLPFYVLSCILIFSLGIAIYYVLSQRKVAANVSNKSIV
ncbi:MFS transporter [Bacillus toyonensis]|uniref:MFS transporter n=1 Tax=Bacillus toyonensis TaxID=155322 RepID=UPI000BED0A9E|nr:MFS transporter [Bacillus toyonensis]PEC37327.1 MFS transporter [Bacillus toyonensis]PED61040.1 MFS transporter [Bacillus toyonensis]PEK01670.1 MFS transporter [Bacillus toyonensis]PEL01238.1 MFS transporter [Bacillus toyonensis]PEN33946.1 MFS transporter [Bacillus toyonensis]